MEPYLFPCSLGSLGGGGLLLGVPFGDRVCVGVPVGIILCFCCRRCRSLFLVSLGGPSIGRLGVCGQLFTFPHADWSWSGRRWAWRPGGTEVAFSARPRIDRKDVPVYVPAVVDVIGSKIESTTPREKEREKEVREKQAPTPQTQFTVRIHILIRCIVFVDNIVHHRRAKCHRVRGRYTCRIIRLNSPRGDLFERTSCVMY